MDGGGEIHSNHFQMKMIIYNNENKTTKNKKPVYFKQQGADDWNEHHTTLSPYFYSSN